MSQGGDEVSKTLWQRSIRWVRAKFKWVVVLSLAEGACL